MTAFVSAPNVCAARKSAVALVEPVTAQSVKGSRVLLVDEHERRAGGIRSSRRLPGTPTSQAWATSPVRLTAYDCQAQGRVRPTLVSIAVPHAEPAADHRRSSWASSRRGATTSRKGSLSGILKR
jgi:hypothetical protein